MRTILSRELKALRILNGFTQEDIAKKLGIGVPAYSKRENEQIEFSLSELKKLKKYLKITDEKFIEIFFTN